MRRMSAGSGYQYLLRSVAAGDGDRVLSTPLTRYYSEVGTPPGRWLGSGLAALGGGQIGPGMRVTEAQRCSSGWAVTRSPGIPTRPSVPGVQAVSERIEARVAPSTRRCLHGADCGAETPGSRPRSCAAPAMRRAVAGFDFTFSVPKSASVLWGGRRRRVASAHRGRAPRGGRGGDRVLEREVAATRPGISDAMAPLSQVDVTGVAPSPSTTSTPGR